MEFSSNRKILKMGLLSPFFVFFNSIFYILRFEKNRPCENIHLYIQTFVTLWIYANMWMFVECGKLQKNVENSPKNVENLWKSAWKMWITAPKMWKTLWIKCGNVENMWETHLYVQMCKIVANYTNVSQFFLFLLSSFFFLLWFLIDRM